MYAHSTTGRLLVGLAVVALLAGCGGGGSLSPAPPTGAPTSVPSGAVATPSPSTAAATSSPTPSVVVTSTVPYESANPRMVPGVLDVYAPTKAGPWPVVVLFPAFNRASLSEKARRVADLGFVVFVPSWGHVPEGGADNLSYDGFVANNAQGACAVEFARAHAAEYGGDPGTMIVFGHSAGAHLAAMVAFARPEPSAGCLAGTTLGAIDALITREGDWLIYEIQPPQSPLKWDGMLAAHPSWTRFARAAEHGAATHSRPGLPGCMSRVRSPSPAPTPGFVLGTARQLRGRPSQRPVEAAEPRAEALGDTLPVLQWLTSRS
jgi:pimeloyl-ACP methyl ester carboxylesterase